jgi:hypothetical protein
LKKIGRNIWLTLIGIVAAIFVDAQGVAFYASVDKNPVESGEVFSLRLTLENGRGNIEAPDLSDFQVIFGPSQSSSYRIVNGAQSSNITLSYTMRAKAPGTYTIGTATAKVGNKTYTSEPISLTVVKGTGSSSSSNQGTGSTSQQRQQSSGGSAKTDENLKVQILASKTNVFQGEQIVLTYVLLSRYNNIDLGSTDFPSLSGFWVEEVNLGQTTWEDNYEMINGVPYRKAVLKQQVIFAQRPGELQIPPLKITSRVNRSFFNPGTEVSATSNSPLIKVKALPGNPPESFDGAVGDFSFAVKTGATSLKTNEAIDLTMTITGKGNLTLVKNPEIIFPADFDAYDPELKNRISINGAGVSGSRTYQYLVIPRYPGKYEVPAINFTYFDPAKEKYVTLNQGPFQFEVTGDAASTNADGSAVAKSKVEQTRSDIRYIMTDAAELEESGKIFFRSAGFYGALSLPFLAFLGFIMFRKRQQAIQGDVQGSRKRKANKMARKRLSDAEKAMKSGDSKAFYAEIFKAMYGYLGDKLGQPAANLSKPLIRQSLQSAGADAETTEETIAVIETCEMARFAPAAEQSDNSFYQRTVSLIEKLEGILK